MKLDLIKSFVLKRSRLFLYCLCSELYKIIVQTYTKVKWQEYYNFWNLFFIFYEFVQEATISLYNYLCTPYKIFTICATRTLWRKEEHNSGIEFDETHFTFPIKCSIDCFFSRLPFAKQSHNRSFFYFVCIANAFVFVFMSGICFHQWANINESLHFYAWRVRTYIQIYLKNVPQLDRKERFKLEYELRFFSYKFLKFHDVSQA